MNHIIKAISALFVLALFSSGTYAHNKVVVISMGDGGGKVFSNCKETLDAGASSGNGVYLIDTVGDGLSLISVYCDMATGTTYEAFAYGNHSSTYTDYTLPDIATWQNAAFQQAYIWHHNTKGLPNIDPDWPPGNCCFYLANDLALLFDGNHLYPYDQSGFSMCGQTSAGTYYAGINNDSASPELVLPMPPDYFLTNSVTQGSHCSIDNNPGIFVKSYQ